MTLACGSGDDPSVEEPYPELSIDGFIESLVKRVLWLAETLRLDGFTPSAYQALLARRPAADTSATSDGQQESEAIGSAARDSAPDPSLFFRAYIPTDRLYSAEMDTFLSLFRGWASAVRGRTIRQGGYETATGKVFEFYLDDATAGIDFTRERADFSTFLALCASDPTAAVDRLVEDGMARPQASAFAARYAKQLRRLNLDLRQERERRILELTHDIEVSLLDLGEEPDAVTDQVRAVLDVLVPDVSAKTYQGLLGPGRELSQAGIGITVNQFFGKVESVVAASVNGEAGLGLQAKELIALIDAHGGDRADALRSAVFELEDKDAPSAKRRYAKQRLKAFLVQIGKFTRKVGIDLLEKYLESQIGVT